MLLLRTLLVSAGPLGGRPARDHRRVLDAIVWFARTGAPWRDRPFELDNRNSVFGRFRCWSASGLWAVMLEALADGGGDAELLQRTDSTSRRVHSAVAAAMAKAAQRLEHVHQRQPFTARPTGILREQTIKLAAPGTTLGLRLLATFATELRRPRAQELPLHLTP